MQRLLGQPASQKASRPPGAGREALTRSGSGSGSGGRRALPAGTKVCIMTITKGHTYEVRTRTQARTRLQDVSQMRGQRNRCGDVDQCVGSIDLL